MRAIAIAIAAAEVVRMPEASAILCPYCGSRQKLGLSCEACGGRFDVASMRATQNDMGAWHLRDSRRPHFVGCSLETMIAAIRAGEIARDAIVRGPTTRQFWTIARRAAGIAHLFGRCYACQGPVSSDDGICGGCGARPPTNLDRNFLGLPVVEGAPPLADPGDPELALRAGFTVESGVFVVRVEPATPPDATSVRVLPPVAPPALAPAPAPAPAPIGPARSAAADPRAHPSSRVDAAAAQPSAAEPPPAGPASASPIERSLAVRVRSLERINRLLLLATVGALFLSLFITAAYVALRDARDKELAKVRRDTLAEIEAEFERATPVTRSATTEIPAAPDAPPAGVNGAATAPR